jgi:hypothetical protein
LNIRDLKVFKGFGASLKEMPSEESVYNAKLMELRNTFVNTPIGQLSQKMPFLNGIPLSPFPRMSRCLGLDPHNGVIRIRNGYVQVAFDLKVKEGDSRCLY